MVQWPKLVANKLIKILLCLVDTNKFTVVVYLFKHFVEVDKFKFLLVFAQFDPLCSADIAVGIIICDVLHRNKRLYLQIMYIYVYI